MEEITLLIHGETGSGKELFARAIHFNGYLKEKPFLVENCEALRETAGNSSRAAGLLGLTRS